MATRTSDSRWTKVIITLATDNTSPDRYRVIAVNKEEEGDLIPVPLEMIAVEPDHLVSGNCLRYGVKIIFPGELIIAYLCVGYTTVWSGIYECNEYIPLQTMV